MRKVMHHPPYLLHIPRPTRQFITVSHSDVYINSLIPYVSNHQSTPNIITNMKTFVALSALLALALADHPAPYHPAPAPYQPAPSYNEVPAAYQYQYAVKDDYSGVNFGADETHISHADLIRRRGHTSFRDLVSNIMIELANVASLSGTRLCGDISLSLTEQEAEVMSQGTNLSAGEITDLLLTTNDDMTGEQIQITRSSPTYNDMVQNPSESPGRASIVYEDTSVCVPVGRQSISPTLSHVTNSVLKGH
ncbi:unnamed protein product [Lepeophtheirus salmonis]|uniref:(salmon louse) hypothetical protein n=1 Tax=Lepeophtheirus salmonis TaxID=72036 RepID=A0A7R8D7E4_LEPSM|nr:unnamed protein product [Lepeophtheirus salmonis]CAF3026354.1 unnamed protein product [Lepeophtheirus salmonis]